MASSSKRKKDRQASPLAIHCLWRLVEATLRINVVMLLAL
jgi:hypothetical protein